MVYAIHIILIILFVLSPAIYAENEGESIADILCTCDQYLRNVLTIISKNVFLILSTYIWTLGIKCDERYEQPLWVLQFFQCLH